MDSQRGVHHPDIPVDRRAHSSLRTNPLLPYVQCQLRVCGSHYQLLPAAGHHLGVIHRHHLQEQDSHE